MNASLAMVYPRTGRNLLNLEQPIDKPLEGAGSIGGKGGGDERDEGSERACDILKPAVQSYL